jgi:DNA-binding NarL/FixJ family response regulator
MSGQPIRVLVVDDDALVRSGLLMMLGGRTDLVLVGEAADGAAAVEAVRAGGVDVVLMDVRMPGLDGIAATGRIRALPQPPQVIMLTTFAADELVVRALREGAAGYLVKDTPPADIVRAVHTVAGGEAMLSPSITRSLIASVAGDGAADRRDRARQRLATLSEREADVARAVGRGASNAEIAAELYLSVATVKAHVSRLLDKLGVGNRVQVALLAHDAEGVQRNSAEGA